MNPASGPSAGDWFQSSNWSPSAIPTTLTAASIANGGEARATTTTAPGPIAVNRLEVGRNDGSGTLTSLEVSIQVDSDFDVGEIGGSFATGNVTVDSDGRATLSDMDSLVVGFNGDGDLDVGQAGATLGASANSRGAVTIERTGVVQIFGDVDVGQASADSGSTTLATANLIVVDIDNFSVSGDFDVGPVGGDGMATSMAIANLSDVTTATVGSDIDVGIASGSSGSVNAGDGRLTITNSSLQVGFDDPLLPAGLNVGDISAVDSERAMGSGEVTLQNVQLAVAAGIDVGNLSGGGGVATNT
ncbi:MAG: hypothetical protein ACR2NU_05665, partial [Aeoliella sp.]